jgi:TIR domain
VADAANEFQSYSVRFQKSAMEARSRLLPRAEVALNRVVNELSEDPNRFRDRFPDRVDGTIAGVLVYKHPDPPLEISYRIDADQMTIVDVVERAVVGALVVVSYSHQDVKWRDELRKFLKPLVRQKRIRIWDDTAIGAGKNWQEEIKRAFASANVAILLMSSDFQDSDFISQEELPLLLDRAKKKEGGLTLLWIAVRPSTFELQPEVATLQALNEPSRPLSKLQKPAWETELTKVCRKILAEVENAAVSAGP